MGTHDERLPARWRANWDVLIKRGKRGLLTFYDVEEGREGQGKEGRGLKSEEERSFRNLTAQRSEQSSGYCRRF